MKEIILQILNDSITAPSPDNFQPWRFEVRNNELAVFKVPGKVNQLLDCKEHVLLLTNGMLIENIVIAATHHGYRSELTLMPDPSKPDLVAKILLHRDSGINEDPLYPFLTLRSTNRKLYKKEKLSPEISAALLTIQHPYPGVELQLIEHQDDIKSLGKAVSAIDKIMFENKKLHDSLFAHMTTSKKEMLTKQGLVLDAMEFNPAEKLLFSWLTNWRVVKLFNFFGFSSFVRFKNSKQYGSAAAAFLVGVKNNSETDYLIAGRAVERCWLKATEGGLSFHPIVGVLYCYQKVKENLNDVFSEDQATLLEESYKKIESIATANGMTGNHLVFFSRVGHATPPSHKSLRKNADVDFLNS